MTNKQGPPIASNNEISLTGRALWLLFAKALAFAFSIGLPLLLVRRLSQHDFGLYKQAFLVLGSALALLPLGFQMSAFYFLPREHGRQGQIVLNILGFHVFMAALGCLALIFFPQLLSTIFRSSELVDYAPLIGLAIFLWVVSSFLEVVSVAHQEARLSSVFIIASQVSKTLLLLAAAVIFGSVRSLIYAAIIQGLIQTCILLFYLRSRFEGFWRRFEWSVLRMQLSYALPFGFAGLLYTLQTDLHNYFVSNRFDAATFAIYAIGCFDVPLVGILNESVGAVMIPRVSSLQKEGDHSEILQLMARAMRKLALIYLPMYGFLIVMGREVLTVLFTDRYAASWPIFAINLTLLPLSVLVLDPIMRAYAQHRHFLLKLHVTLVVILAITLWFGIGRFGLLGAISIVVGINLSARIATTIKVSRILRVKWSDLRLIKNVFKTAIGVAGAALITAAVRSLLIGVRPFLLLIICGSVFALCFLVAGLILGLFTDDERIYIRRQIDRLRTPKLGRTAQLLL